MNRENASPSPTLTGKEEAQDYGRILQEESQGCHTRGRTLVRQTVLLWELVGLAESVIGPGLEIGLGPC